MAFEVFDDVGFFFFFFTVLSIILLPWTLSLLYSSLCPNPDAPAQKTTTTSKILFALSWLLFVYMLVQISYFSTQKMATFDPYEILKIEKGAAYPEIKKAYREMALMYHPDKFQSVNPEEVAEAEAMFIMVNKAHQVLTDETTRMNWEKYGNPDGYQGTSVTIGLPSFLTNANNEKLILVGYFIIFFVIVPLIVFACATRFQRFHDSGLMNNTVGLFVQFVEENWTAKFLVQTFSGAEEFAVYDRVVDEENFGKLVREIDRLDVTAKVKKDKPGNFIVLTLAHAHMLRLELSNALQNELNAPRILDVMFDIQMAKHFYTPAKAIIDLMQLMSQGLFLHDNPLLQVPFVTTDTVKALLRKNIKTLRQLASLTPVNRKELFQSADIWPTLNRERKLKSNASHSVSKQVVSKAELEVEIILSEIEKAIASFPFVNLTVDYEVPGENRPEEKQIIRVDELYQLNVKLNRLRLEELEGKLSVKVKSDKKATLVEEFSEEKESLDNQEDIKKEDSKPARVSWCNKIMNFFFPVTANDPNSLDSILDSPDQNKLISSVRYAYTPRLPEPKPERWIVMLVDANTSRPLNIQRVVFPEGDFSADVKFTVQASEAGTVSLEIRAFCDTYLGLDPESKVLKINISPAFTEEQILASKKATRERLFDLSHPSLKNGVDHDDDDEDLVEFDPQYDDIADKLSTEEAPIYWYYLWNSTFLEFILTLVLLGLLGIVIFDILHSRGYWQQYVQPTIDRIWTRIEPFLPAGDSAITRFMHRAYSFISTLGAGENNDVLMTAK